MMIYRYTQIQVSTSLYRTLHCLFIASELIVVDSGARLGYHPHLFSTAECIEKSNENVARQNANEEKNICIFLKVCHVANRRQAAHNGSRIAFVFAAIQNV